MKTKTLRFWVDGNQIDFVVTENGDMPHVFVDGKDLSDDGERIQEAISLVGEIALQLEWSRSFSFDLGSV